ncbi:ATP-binding protein [Peribacillus asahii]|uniref:ATP-binding protein n=1 Tax=Peribacillus asahii TaxID=228899 RepID=UPI0020795F13|nr:ATP-binding protein [Peribacillus asahii]USK86863.1 two-component sensor histidine kinase [Peribacillus asahii]
MSLITKDLLINFLFTILPLFLVQMIYFAKYSYRFENLKRRTFAIFPIVSLILCMIFPVDTGPYYVWDLRWIPFILGWLYGGYKLGIPLLFLMLFIRFWLNGDNGFYIACITFFSFSIVLFFISKYFSQFSVKYKVIISSSLTFIGLMLSLLVSEQLFNINRGANLWTQYISIQIIAMVFTNLLWEVIQANFQVLQKLVKAEKLQMVSHLAASISHEVRNPLTASRGFIQMLSEETSDQKRKQYTEIALQELDRATEVINDYLTFAKPALEKEEKIHVAEEIQHVINIITPLANMNSIQIKLSLLEDDQYVVKGERKKFQQCLINMLKNGIESMETNGKLHVIQTNNQDTIQIDIRDEGSGMTQEQINRLGEPYFTTKEKGTGLGMMVSYSIINQMNGQITVVSEQGIGTCFSIKLPIYQ